MKYRYYLIFLLILLLNGCATHRTPLQEPVNAAQRQQVWQTHVAQLQQLQRFDANGVFVYQDPQGKHQANFAWSQYSTGHYQLLLLSPFGTTLLKLNVSPTQSILNSDGKTYYARQPEALIQRLTGLSIPVSILQQWLLGIPAGATDYQLDQYALLQQASLLEGTKTWQLAIPSYTIYQGVALPQTLQLQQDQLHLNLKINRWSFPQVTQVSLDHE